MSAPRPPRGPRSAAPKVPVESLAEPEPYTGRFMTCRKPFKLGGKRYTIGDEVPVDLIPRSETWVRTGFLQEAS